MRVLAIAMAVMLAAACGGDDDDGGGGGGSGGAGSVPELSVVASEDGNGGYSYELPDELSAGATRIALTNDGDELHHAQLFALNDGATVEELAGALATGDPAAALEFGAFTGGTAIVAAHETSRADAIVELAEGSYAFICFVPDGSGVPHLAHGMLVPFDVVSSGDPVPAPEPDVRVELVDYGFDLPDTMSGDALLEITNTAEAEPHEMIVGQLDDGAAVQDVIDALAAGEQPPYKPVGGMQAILPGATESLQLDLDPGEYVVLCEIPGMDDGTPHHALGMIRPVTITRS